MERIPMDAVDDEGQGPPPPSARCFRAFEQYRPKSTIPKRLSLAKAIAWLSLPKYGWTEWLHNSRWTYKSPREISVAWWMGLTCVACKGILSVLLLIFVISCSRNTLSESRRREWLRLGLFANSLSRSNRTLSEINHRFLQYAYKFVIHYHPSIGSCIAHVAQWGNRICIPTRTPPPATSPLSCN
jgi:hypothetical protein